MLVPTYDIEHHTPFWFTSTGARDPNNWSYQRAMRDAARSSLATPAYFAPAKLDCQADLGPFTLIDGLVYAPNPTLCAYIQAARYDHADAVDFLVLSLGTGTADLASLRDDVQRWGRRQWLAPLLGVVIRSASETVERSLATLLPPSHDIQRYYRFQVRSEAGAGQFDANSRESLSRLRSLGEMLIRDSEEALDQVCRRLTELAQSPPDDEPARAEEAGGERAQQLLAAHCAAVEALLELAESDGRYDLLLEPGRLRNWAATVERRPGTADLAAFAFCLAGRALALHARWTGAGRAFVRSEAALSHDRRDAPTQRWADWRAPASLPDRVRLERLRILPPYHRSIPQETLTIWREAATSHREAAPTPLDFLDSERLVSAIMQEQLAHGIESLATVHALDKSDRYPPERKLEPGAPQAHRSTPPLVGRLALALAALGQGETAWKVLEDRGNRAAERGDGEVSNAVALAQLQVVRRLRLSTRGRGLVAKLAQSTEEVLVCALWLVIAVNSPASGDDWSRPAPPDGRSAAVLHAWWASQPGLTREQAERLLQTLQAAWPTANHQLQATQSAGLEVLLNLDWQEAMQLASIWGLPLEARPFPEGAKNWIQDHPADTLVALQLVCRAMALSQEMDLDAWSDELGQRRVAEVAFEEGELLALRLPRLAVRLLDIAYHRFEKAGDLAGATIASIRSTIALIHARELGAARLQLDSVVRDAYRAWVEAAADSRLPAWTDLVLWSRAEDPAQRLSDLNHPDWGGWLFRLFECLVWVRTLDQEDGTPTTRKREVDRLQQLQRKMRDALVVLTGHADLPVELDLSLGQAGSREGGKPLSSFEKVVEVVKESNEAIARLVAFLETRVLPWLFSKLAAQIEAQIRIEDAARRVQGASPSPSVTSVVIDFVARLTFVHPYWSHQRLLSAEEIVAPTLEAYRTMAQRLPQGLIKELRFLQTSLGKQALSIPLVIDPALPSLPWEAMLTLALPARKDSAWRETLQFWRSDDAPALGTPAKSSWQQGAVLAMCVPSWRLMVEKGWSALGFSVIPTTNVEAALDSTAIKLLHLIGTTIITGADLRFLISDHLVGGHEQSMAEEPAALRRGTLLASNQLPLAHVPVIVLQAEPSRLARRLHADREQMSLLRRYAAQVFSAGARAVILLPTLPTALGEAVLQTIARHLAGDDPPDVSRLLQALAATRQLIVEWRAPESDADPDQVDAATLESDTVVPQLDLRDSQMELAMDVCLYARRV